MALLPAVACSARQSAADPAPPGMSDSLDCRVQARRQARAQYPAPRAQGGLQRPLPSPDEQDRSAAENRYFDECMRQKGSRDSGS